LELQRKGDELDEKNYFDQFDCSERFWTLPWFFTQGNGGGS
jgi:hypothetical protein